MRIKTLFTMSAVAAAAAITMQPAVAAEITGAGASFPAPVYSKWADAYKTATGNKVNYQSVGSGAGIKQIIAKTVDFGASDAPLKPEELKKEGLMQFPTVLGGVVPVVNIPGIKAGEVKLSGDVLAKIYLAEITKWNDPAIAALNPGVKLPDADIAVVRRADGSGTTFIFTSYLSAVSDAWKTKVGADKAVNWPTGMGGKGNEGVSAFLQRIPNSIGYVEYAYAKQNKLAYVKLKNKEGNFVSPTSEAFAAAGAGADWSNAFYVTLVNQPGKDSWPISGATFILMHTTQDKPEQGKEVLKFFQWAYKDGDKMADELDYVPLADATVKLIDKAWTGIKDSSGKAIWP